MESVSWMGSMEMNLPPGEAFGDDDLFILLQNGNSFPS